VAPTVQFNVRTAPEVAEAVRARAEARGCSLGDALGEMVDAARASQGEGILLRPDPALRRALAALAASRGGTEADILEDALRGELRLRLLRLADAVAPPGASAQTTPPPAAPPEDGVEAEVGVFTVFD
jgi:hypothetical protein